MSRSEMESMLQQYCFAMYDAHLYLDTHPRDKAALAYYKNMEEGYNKLYAQYLEEYPPMMPMTQPGAEYWQWIEGPWPWHMSEEA